MKARKLVEILNNTEYSPNDNRDYIAVGTPMCHNLLSVDKKTLEVKYALDTFKEGRKSLERKTDELLFIWDKLHELVESGDIHDIINGHDEIENPLPVFSCENGEVIESHTDKYGWPNTTYDGKCMYANEWFKTVKEAVEYAIRDAESGVKFSKEMVVETEEKLVKYLGYVKDYETHLEKYNNIL